MALVSSRFCIDRWEAGLVLADDQGEKPFSPFASVGNAKVRAVSREGIVPQAYVSRDEAARACRASGKRLCREQEWLMACLGGAPGPYPYGPQRARGACNDSGTAPLPFLFSRSDIPMYGDRAMNDPRLNQVAGTVAKTGSHPACVTRDGAYDMVGNLHEWVDDPAGTFRGGYYLDTKLNGLGCEYRTTAHVASYHDYSTGFRCCADPAPPR